MFNIKQKDIAVVSGGPDWVDVGNYIKDVRGRFILF